MAVLLLVLCGVGTLAVDYGRVQLVKTQLQTATDGAARYAAAGMRSTMMNTSGAAANAAAMMAANQVDGAPAPFNAATDLSLGVWVPATKTFTPTTVAAVANAVRLSTKLTLGTSSHPFTLLSLFGRTVDVRAVTIVVVSGQDATTYVSAKGNPWLAGMPAGTVSNDFRTSSSEWDTAGGAPNVNSSPAQISLASLGAGGGSALTFDGVTGSANFGSGSANSDADGDASRLINLGSPTFGSYANFTSPTYGMSNCHGPINAMVAVFLDDSLPTSSAAPGPLDFSTADSRDFTSLSPQLKQVFFVGDGRRPSGEVQQFVVPAGATRLFIANMDGWQYNDNSGGYDLSMHATQTVTMVYVE